MDKCSRCENDMFYNPFSCIICEGKFCMFCISNQTQDTNQLTLCIECNNQQIEEANQRIQNEKERKKNEVKCENCKQLYQKHICGSPNCKNKITKCSKCRQNQKCKVCNVELCDGCGQLCKIHGKRCSKCKHNTENNIKCNKCNKYYCQKCWAGVQDVCHKHLKACHHPIHGYVYYKNPYFKPYEIIDALCWYPGCTSKPCINDIESNVSRSRYCDDHKGKCAGCVYTYHLKHHKIIKFRTINKNNQMPKYCDYCYKKTQLVCDILIIKHLPKDIIEKIITTLV